MNNTVTKNPAASFGVAGALALLIARAMGVDDADTIVAMATVILAAPAAVTWFVGIVRPVKPTLPPPSDHL